MGSLGITDFFFKFSDIGRNVKSFEDSTDGGGGWGADFSPNPLNGLSSSNTYLTLLIICTRILFLEPKNPVVKTEESSKDGWWNTNWDADDADGSEWIDLSSGSAVKATSTTHGNQRLSETTTRRNKGGKFD